MSPLVTWEPTSPGRPSSTTAEVLPFRTKLEVVIYQFRFGGRDQCSYDYETLADLLVECGFDAVHEERFGSSALPELAIDRDFRATQSLVVEAAAPPG